MSVVMVVFSRAEAFKAGKGRGHTAANWQEAQESLPVPDVHEQAARVAADQSSYDRSAFADGYVEGWELRMDGKFEDGTPMDEEEQA